MKLSIVLLVLGIIAAEQLAYADDMGSDGQSDGTTGGDAGVDPTDDEGTSDDDEATTTTTGAAPTAGVNKPIDNDTGTTGAPKNLTIQKTPGNKKQRLFTPEWRKLYKVSQLKNQAKWRLAENQPEDGSFQTRMYPAQWWSTSHTPCAEESLASGNQYMNLYFFVNGFNYQRAKYPLTYPVLFEVDKRPIPTQPPTITPKRKTQPKRGRGSKRGGAKKPKSKKVCPVKYTTHFYLPIPLKKWAPKTQDKTIKSFKMNPRIYYVREYAGNYTTAYCGEQGRQLALDLLRNNVWTWETNWLCAKYEAPDGSTEQKLEVWMKKRLYE